MKEKKEIWKLIELLNEYEKRESWISNARTTNFAFLYYLNNPAPISELNLISKKYWFIKWLVENDKIDWLKFYGENEYTPIWVNAKSDIDQVYSIEEQILMILSISDTPIEDLISYLR